MGKTALALGLATNVAALNQLPVLFFSLEMGHKELAQRILASEARVDSQKLRTGKLDQSDWSKIGKALGRLEVPLFIDENPNVTVMEIRAKARRIKSRYGGLGTDRRRLPPADVGGGRREPPAGDQRDLPRAQDPRP